MKGAGGFEQSGAHGERTPRSVRHAEAARRAVARLLAAKLEGDERAAARHARTAARAVDRHLAALRRLP